VFLKLLGCSIIGLGIALLSHILIVTIQNPPFLWQGFIADAAVLALVVGVVMLVAVPFAGLRQMGSAFLVLGIAIAVLSEADILIPSVLIRLGVVIVALVGGYLLLLKGSTKE
jgi:hypothetical protein